MKKNHIVEPAISVYVFAYSMLSPLTQQYVYMRLWEETTNSTYIHNDNVSQCQINQSDPTYLNQKEVQEKASLFAMKMDLSGAAFSIVVAFLLVANGDRYGRKISLILPVVGALVQSLFFTIMSQYSLNLSFMFALAFIIGLFGGMAAFLGGAFAFVVDLCENQRQKTIRIAMVDLLYGLMSGLGGLLSGYILKGIGYTWTFVTISVLHTLNIFYVTCCLDDTVQVSEFRPGTLKEGLKEFFSTVYVLFQSATCRKRTIIILLLCTFMTYLFAMFGGISLYTLYELNAPLCWDAVYIGYGSAASISASLTGFLGLLLISRYLRDIYLVFIGIFSYIGGSVMAAFAKTTLLMFLVRIPSALLFIPLPVLRSMLSKAVLPKEQGAIFACIACLEVMTGTIALVVFNSLYAETVGWFPGFSFLFSAGFCIIPLSLLSWLLYATWQDEGLVQLVNGEDSPEGSAES